MYNPYVYPDGNSIPIEKIEVVAVPMEFCENFEENLSVKSQMQAPISLIGAADKPWVIKYWDEPWEREEGISMVFDSYERFEDAYSDGKKAARLIGWSCFEIQLQTPEAVYAVYCYAVTEPIADEFIKN